MTVLKNDYLYSYILKFILSYNYISTFKNYPFTNYNFSDTEFLHLNIETLNYSLVSKKFFEIIKNELLKITKFKNFGCLKYFMDYKSSSKFKLISQENSIMIYNSYKEYNSQDRSITSKFKKVFVREEGNYRSQQILLSNQVFPSNVQFELNLYINDHDHQVTLYSDDEDYENEYSAGTIINFKLYRDQFNQFLEKPLKRIHTLSLLECGIGRKENSTLILNNINKLCAKQITYRSTEGYYFTKNWNYIDYTSPIFSSPNYKRITIVYGLQLPSDYLPITPNLKNLSLVFDFKKISHLKLIENDWNDLVELNLIKNQSVKYLEILNHKKDEEEEEGGNELGGINHSSSDHVYCNCIGKPSIFSNGFNKLFSSPNCSIETLEINRFNGYEQNSLFFNGLVSNKSINTVIFYSTNSKVYFEKVFFDPIQNTIRNIIILNTQENELNELFNLFTDNKINAKGTLDLYSFTFETELGISLELVDQIIVEINKYNYKIKEYNFYIKNTQIIKNPIILLNNGSIVNLRKVAEEEEEEEEEEISDHNEGYDYEEEEF